MNHGFEDQIERAVGVRLHKQNVREHFYCVKEIFDLYKTPEQLKKLSERTDLDTICAWDYQRMKSYALSGEGLKMNDWHSELRGIKEMPKLQ